ncbi:hypothetical protein [Montanilutibacter psychrotolerans]|uniref:hypothetical protein n=1 Tax=Montanilutibacter psychrotolerans TaxID=1327343 RepID=UPI0011CEA463|nr:hypothetical protein [Lysobacter psychrotolerans]
MDLSSWFDCWHTHVDWQGRGDAKPENQADAAATTVRVLRYLEQRAQNRREPIQLWATICEGTMDNAVYAHSLNPNGTPYPNDFAGAQWDVQVPDRILAALSGDAHQVGTVSYGDAVVHLVRKRLPGGGI